jgi:two-component system chemotaxis sensor kinase CheA
VSLEDIQQRLMGTFLEENTEGLARFEAGLLSLEKGTSDPELIGDIFRAIHSLKGSAASFGFTALASLAHEMETHLDHVRAGTRGATPELISVLLGGVDLLRRLLASAGGSAPVDPAEVAAACVRVRELHVDAPPAAGHHWHLALTPGPELFTRGLDPVRLFRELRALGGEVVVTADTSRLPRLELINPLDCHLAWSIDVRGAVERKDLEALFEWLDGGWTLTEVPAVAHASTPTPPPQGERKAEPSVDPSQASVRVTVNKLDQLMNMVGELVITQAILGELDESRPLTPELITRLREGLTQLASNTRALQESVMRLRSMPLSTVFARLPRLVHDLSAQLGKKAELVVTGESTELDKTVLERLGDPLVHLVRNCLDHGLEKPAARVAKGKPETGTLSISARHRGSDIFVEVADDGAGLDLEKILARGVERGLVPAGARPPDEQLINLIFQPGFSTAEAVTDVSGRGVGMDVVQRNVRALGGDITVSSVKGAGTRFVLRLPLTLAIIDGQLVRVGARTFVVPLLSIVESVQPEKKLVHPVGDHAVYRLRDELVPMVDLAPVLGVEGAGPVSEKLIVVVESDEQHVGLLVDELLGQQQVVVKSLEQNYGAVPGIAGATILGDGNVSFILEMSSLLQRMRARPALAAA